eukprot:COSAG02_NODE_4271_length_5563_cov_3.829063_8_plen_62_part_00
MTNENMTAIYIQPRWQKRKPHSPTRLYSSQSAGFVKEGLKYWMSETIDWVLLLCTLIIVKK